ncbi:MAG: DUF4340 domain-containing protein [Oscillospiraceae bacterium]
MAKLSKTTKTVIIAAAVLLVLGAVLLVLLLTKPAEERDTSSADSSSEASTSVTVTDHERDEVTSLTVRNETGGFTFVRNERVVSTTDDDGNVSSSSEYYWTSAEMKGLTPNETTVNSFIGNMASFSTKSLVEENAQDLEKYGLKEPLASVTVNFEDGSKAELCFGIKNPASTGSVYFRLNDSNDVHLVSNYTVGSAYYDIKDFVGLLMTDAYNANSPLELDYLIIERKDMEEPVEIRYMYDVAEESQKEDSVLTTFNSHRFITPISAEVDSTKGQTLCYGLYGLSMSSCEYLEQTEENLAATGLDDPFVRITFKYGSKRRVLLLGDEIVEITETDSVDTPSLKTVTGYYAMFEGEGGIYSIAKDKAPWYTFTVQSVMSRRPISPYIYTVDTVTIKTADNEYVFRIDGVAGDNTIYCNGEEVVGDRFRELYQHLIASVGEELYFDEPEGELVVSVTFKYRDEYVDLYGTDEDVLEYYSSDDRKNIVKVNGSVLFKVRDIYTERLLSNVEAVLENGKVELNW